MIRLDDDIQLVLYTVHFFMSMAADGGIINNIHWMWQTLIEAQESGVGGDAWKPEKDGGHGLIASKLCNRWYYRLENWPNQSHTTMIGIHMEQFVWTPNDY